MSLLAKAGGGDFTPAPQGVHASRCFSVLDLGTQQRNWQGEIKARHEIRLTFELLGEEKRDDDKPFTVSKVFTLSLNENSALRPFLEAWRGRPFTPEELDGFELPKLCGAPCLLNIVHETKDQKTYPQISSIMPIPKGQTPPEQVNPNVVFDIESFDQDTFDALPEKTQETIAASFEYQEQFGNKPLKSKIDINNLDLNQGGPDTVIEDIGEEPINLDDIPF